MVARLSIVLSCLLLTCLGGCSSGSQANNCIFGASEGCYCPTGQRGAQTCTSAGTFAACVCSAPTVDAGVAGGSDGAATSPRDAVAIGPSDSAATSPPDAATTEDSSGDSAGMDGDEGPVVDAAAYQSADVPAVIDAAPPANDASTDANRYADQ